MIYTIENQKVKVEISDLGAEIQSIYGKTTKFEYLWQGNPEFWKNRATNIFPICGRLKDGKYTYNGKEYEMVLHGFAKLNVFKVLNNSDTTITFCLKNNEDTLKIYPFEFTLKITYTLNGATLKTEYTVENNGKGDLPFSIGGHPGFNVPLDNGIEFEEHYLEFDNKCKCSTLTFAESCLINGEVPFALENDKIIRLKHSLFDNDAVFLKGMDNTVTLKSDKTNRYVKMHFNDMTRLGLWHKPLTKAPYVCIEPWHGVPATDGIEDDFATKQDFIHLDSGKTYSTFFEISVNE